MTTETSDEYWMRRALQLARQGEGCVEPNPMVGAVVLDVKGHFAGEGFHQKFGGPHAEVFALKNAGENAAGGTLYVTLEPCAHVGKTPPCTHAIISAGIRKVVIGTTDPHEVVNGRGIAQLRAAGCDVSVGVLPTECNRLIAPFRKLVVQRKPWVIAKWAMTLDGKLATHAGDSQWISSEESREMVHKLRGRVDAIIVGAGTARRDNPTLTARPPGARRATRVVLDGRATLALSSELVQTTRTVPVMCCVSTEATTAAVGSLRRQGVDVVELPASPDGRLDWDDLLAEFGKRNWTNILVEGGGDVLGSLFDRRAIDEVLVFIAPKLVGGAAATTPLGGIGVSLIKESPELIRREFLSMGPDIGWRADLYWPS